VILAPAAEQAPSEGGAAALDLRVELSKELSALVDISPLGLAISIGFVLGLAAIIGLAGPALVRLAWRLGFDRKRRLGLAGSAMRLLGLLIGIAGVLRPLFNKAPFIGVSSLVVLAALATLIAPMQLRNLASGLALSTRSRLREGDLVTIGEFEGTVRDIGLLRVALRTAAGGQTHIPAADFDRLAVTVGSRRAAVPVEAAVHVGPGFDERRLEGLRRALWLCVFRRAGTELVLAYEPTTGQLEVRMDTWARTSVTEVEAHVRELVLARTRPRPLEGGDEADSDGEGDGEGEEVEEA